MLVNTGPGNVIPIDCLVTGKLQQQVDGCRVPYLLAFSCHHGSVVGPLLFRLFVLPETQVDGKSYRYVG